jgi:hypothetical protein
MSQYQLLKSRRFLPLFFTQFLGAFNDNVYKNALVILIIFQGTALFGFDSNMLVTLSGGIFILPYFLFSATAGQLADKYEKSSLIRRVKILEITIISIAVMAFYWQDIALLILLLFLMGAQSAFFGPLKYGILPQHLQENELIGGNGLIQMGTFLAILLGIILGGVLVAVKPHGTLIVAGVVVTLALLGFFASLLIPTATAAAPEIKIGWNIVTQTSRTMQYALENRSVFVAIIAISWFWFVGATYLSQFPAYTKDILGSNEHVVTLLLTMFSIGIGLGSIMCEKLSGGRIEIGLVPLGAAGITLFSIDVYFASQYFITLQLPAGMMKVHELLDIFGSWRVLLDLLLIGLCGGFYIVPLFAMVQQRSNPHHRARVIAANNILNALFMVGSAIGTLWLLRIGMSIPNIFLWLGIFSAIISLIIFLLLPEFVQRFVAWITLKR